MIRLASFLLFFLKELSHIFRILAPLVDQGLHVGREFRVEADHLLCGRMYEAEGLCMKGLARKELEAVLDELTVLCVDGTLTYFCAIIAFVIKERMTYPVEMNADLMGSSCLKAALDHCHVAEAFKNLEVGHSMLAMISVREDPESHTVIRVTSDIACDGALIFLDIAPYDSYITTLDRMYEELLREIELRLFVLSYNQKTRGILIDAMHEHSHSFILGIRTLRDTEMVCEGIHERTAEMAVTRMYDHTGFLIEHEDVIILMYDIERNSLRKDLKSPALIRHDELHDISRAYHIVCLYYLVVDTYVFCLDRQLYSVTRGIFHMCSEVLVHAHRHLTCRDIETVMLEHLLLFILICHLITCLG